jgi:hypothetical protein
MKEKTGESDPEGKQTTSAGRKKSSRRSPQQTLLDVGE